MTKEVFLKDTWPIIEEKLKAGADVTINPGGVSMKPLVIPGRDSVVLTGIPESLKKYDVVLYIRENGQFVLHRIVGMTDGKFIMCGDNQFMWEYGIERGQIIALMKSVIRNKKMICVDSLSYKLYSRVWVSLQRTNYRLRKLRRKILRLK